MERLLMYHHFAITCKGRDKDNNVYHVGTFTQFARDAREAMRNCIRQMDCETRLITRWMSAERI